MIEPGATLGMLGGGQLGRMFTVAARTMGYRVVVLDPDPHSPAGALANEHLAARYLDSEALDRVAAQCAAVSTEFENVPADALERLANDCYVRPAASAVAPVQDRISEKSLLDRHGLPTARWAPVRQPRDLARAVETVGVPAVIKTARGGYDGKGQAAVDEADDAEAAFAEVDAVASILERRVDLEREVSVIVCRAVDGTVATYPPAENVHRHGILFTSTVPAAIDDELTARARQVAIDVAVALDYVGVLGVEMFVAQDGELLINEIAPRPHNSGHYTLDACAASQFEQQVRLLCGAPPADTTLLTPVSMVNLLGDIWLGEALTWRGVIADPSAHLHIYGKRDARSGRKMGHINVVAADATTALARAEAHHRALSGG